MQSLTRIEAQKGYQEIALSSEADIVIGGGGAGVGKTFCLLLDFLYNIQNPKWGGVIFRRTSPQIRNEGGLWDTSKNLYPVAGGLPRETFLEWQFPSGSKLKFSHLEYEKNLLDWQGSQLGFIGFDELTHFTAKMFFYLLSRNRSTCGVRPRVRATCNPDPDSWVADLISWWIDTDTGFPIPERCGVIRYFLKDGENFIWGDTVQECLEKGAYLVERFGHVVDVDDLVKSITFVGGSIYQNRKLLQVNPAYLGNLLAQSESDRAALLDGNWKIAISPLDLFEYAAFLQLFEHSYSVRLASDRYITADIALKGSDKFVVGYWEGYELADIRVLPKSSGKLVVTSILELVSTYKVPHHHIVFDNDGVGGFIDGYVDEKTGRYIDGFINGAIPFNNGAAPLGGESYQNLKTQCYYKMAQKVNEGQVKISERVACTMYDEKMTCEQRFKHERKAIKRHKADEDGKLKINPKAEQKVILSGQSPDMMDMIAMRSYFDLGKKRGLNVEVY